MTEFAVSQNHTKTALTVFSLTSPKNLRGGSKL